MFVNVPIYIYIWKKKKKMWKIEKLRENNVDILDEKISDKNGPK